MAAGGWRPTRWRHGEARPPRSVPAAPQSRHRRPVMLRPARRHVAALAALLVVWALAARRQTRLSKGPRGRRRWKGGSRGAAGGDHTKLHSDRRDGKRERPHGQVHARLRGRRARALQAPAPEFRAHWRQRRQGCAAPRGAVGRGDGVGARARAALAERASSNHHGSAKQHARGGDRAAITQGAPVALPRYVSRDVVRRLAPSTYLDGCSLKNDVDTVKGAVVRWEPEGLVDVARSNRWFLRGARALCGVGACPLSIRERRAWGDLEAFDAILGNYDRANNIFYRGEPHSAARPQPRRPQFDNGSRRLALVRRVAGRRSYSAGGRGQGGRPRGVRRGRSSSPPAPARSRPPSRTAPSSTRTRRRTRRTSPRPSVGVGGIKFYCWSCYAATGPTDPHLESPLCRRRRRGHLS